MEDIDYRKLKWEDIKLSDWAKELIRKAGPILRELSD